MKRVLQYVGIGYLAIGLLYNGVLFIREHGILVASTMNPYDSRTNGGLSETVFWPLHMTGVLRSEKLPPITEPVESTRKPSKGFLEAVR